MDGWYWNEDYALRAFLSYNVAWEICLFGNYAVNRFHEFFAAKMPLCLKNPGAAFTSDASLRCSGDPGQPSPSRQCGKTLLCGRL